jgi:hypothetical protein
MTLYNRGLIETIARKAPLTGTKTVFGRNLGDFMEEYTGFREPYTPLQQAGKEADKFFGSKIRGTARFIAGAPEEKQQGLFSERLFKFEGGLIPKVDPYTGIPYEIKEHKIEFYGGGLTSKMNERKAYRVGLSVEKDVPDVEDDPADRSLDGSTESYNDIAGLDNTPKIPEPVRVQKNEAGVVKERFNNFGNIEARYDTWAGFDKTRTYGEDGRFGAFYSPIAGMRAPLRDIKTKLERYKDTDDAFGHAFAEYLGGGRKGTLEEKIKKATGTKGEKNYNPDVQGYIDDARFLASKEGDKGILRAIGQREGSDMEYYFGNKKNVQLAIETAKYDYPSDTTAKQMVADVVSGIYRKK